MAMPLKLDHCPRDAGCTSKAVWKDVETGELYSLNVKKTSPDKNGNSRSVYQTDYVPHVCTTTTAFKPTVFFLGEWHNPRSGKTRFIGPVRLERSALSAPVDKRKEWVFIKLYKVEDIVWKETKSSPEFEYVPLVKDNK